MLGELGQGGFASEAISADEVFASIPFDVVITERVARARYPQLNAYSARVVLAWYVAREKALGAASVHAAYLATLPDHIKTPYFFDASELVYLNHTNLGTAVRERAPGIRSDYDGALRLVDEADRVEWEQYLWAFCMLSSRSFPYTLMDPDYDGPSTEIMLPLLDVFNHKPATKITWSRQGTIADGGRIAFVAGDPIQQGEQVFNNYGPKVNFSRHAFSLFFFLFSAQPLTYLFFFFLLPKVE
ncbi:hypothetical protein BC940DRAFT_231060 [Gongronella butleri]|nr:hypothetical protein BC940DRAFT_231060 [Gongronella butleri]